MTPSTTFVRGKLKLKDHKEHHSKKKAGKKSSSSTKNTNIDCQTSSNRSASSDLDKEDRLLLNRENNAREKTDPVVDDMTEAERRAKRFKLEREKKDLEKISELSHRERVEMFNENLSKLTELNDIPRVSAAGNG